MIVALVAWRGPMLSGGWTWALRLTGLLAVAGLLLVVLLAARTALRAAPGGPAPAAPAPSRPAREVVVRVPPDGAGAPTVLPAQEPAAVPAEAAVSAPVPPAAGERGALGRLLALAVASTAPVLVVLVLALPGAGRVAVDRVGDAAASGSSSGGSASAPVTGSSPGPSSSPTLPPAPSPPPTPPPSPPPASPSPTGATSATPLPASAASCRHVVVAGDSLWSVAAARLRAAGSATDAASVVTAWHALYAANARAVGPDPDLIHPGLALATCP